MTSYVPGTDLSCYLKKFGSREARFTLLELIRLTEELHSMGWNHGSLTTRCIKVLATPGGYRQLFLTDFKKIWKRADKFLFHDKAHVWSNDRIFYGPEYSMGVDDDYALWLVVAEVFLRELLRLGTMRPMELINQLKHGIWECRPEDKKVFRLLQRYFSESKGELAPTFDDLYDVLSGETPDYNTNL